MIRILIVDDKKDFAQILRKRLLRDLQSEYDVEIEMAQTAEEAAKLLTRAPLPFDIILTDDSLGAGKSGLAWLEELHQQHAEINSILFTGSHELDLQRADKAGIFQSFVKPFEDKDLLWSVRSLIRQRSLSFERNWLATLTHIGTKLQQATTMEEVGNILVQGGTELGFNRVELWRVQPDKQERILFVGYKQAGNVIPRFENFVIRYSRSEHVRQVYDEQKMKFFDGWGQGRGYLGKKLEIPNSPPQKGEWVYIPLINNQRCEAVIVLQEPKKSTKLRTEEKHLLNLFNQEASGAWSRALFSEKYLFEDKVNTIVQHITQQTILNGEPEDLGKLLSVLYEEVNQITPTTNFVVAMKHDEPEIDAKGWLRYAFHMRDGTVLPSYWRPPADQGLIRNFIDCNQGPCFCPVGTKREQRRRGLGLPKRVTKGWIAIPLIVGKETIGAVFIEEFEIRNAWSKADARLVSAIVQRLSHFIQSAWINHQRQQLNEQLGLLQVANERLMTLGQKQPPELRENQWLWHATLTLATASYGFGFNRALFFTVEEGDTVLQGRMGIGHLSVNAARKAWEKDEREGLTTFELYIDHLTSRKLQIVTPADNRVRELRFSRVESVAFAKVIETKKRVFVAQQDALKELPSAFIEHFGAHDYWLVPANAGGRLVGIIVLDTFCETEPPQTFALKYLDTLANEAALIHEDLRRNRAQQQLMTVTRETLSYDATSEPVQVMLQKIAIAAHLITNADSVAIYPLDVNKSSLQFDEHAIVWYSDTTQLVPNRQAQPSLFMMHVFAQGKPVAVDDVMQLVDQQLMSADDPFIKTTGIKSFLVVPLYSQRTNRVRGLFYVNYRWQRQFSQEEVQFVQAFGNLTAIALRNWRERLGLRIEKETREEELRILITILEKALEPGANERILIETVLQQTRAFFHSYDFKGVLTFALFLRTWERRNGSEPLEIRRQYYLSSQGVSEYNDQEDLRGLTGLAMRRGVVSLVGDVSQNDDYRPRRRGIQTEHPERKTQSELDVPVIDEMGQAIGVFNIESSEKDYFTGVHEAMVSRLSRITMLALDTVRRRQFIDLIFKAGQAITLPITLNETLKVIIDQAKLLLPNLSLMTIWYHDPNQNKLSLAAQFGLKSEPDQDEPQIEGAVMDIMGSQKVIWAEDVMLEGIFQKSKFVERERIQSTVAFPLIADGNTIGVIFFAYRQRHIFSRIERELLPILVQFVAIGIHAAQAILRVETEKRRLSAALEVTKAVSTTLDYQQLVINARSLLIQLYQDATILILIYNQQKNTLDIIDDPAHPYPIDNPSHIGRRFIELDMSSMIGALAVQSIQQQKPCKQLIPDISDTGGQPYSHLRSKAQTVIGVTFVDSNGELLGALVVDADVSHCFDQGDVELIAGVATQIGFAVDRSRKIAAIDFRNIVTDSMMWAADLAHDLNRETYHIRSWLQLLREEPSLNSDSLEAVEQIEDSFNLIARDAPWSTQKPIDTPDLAAEVVNWTKEFVEQYRITVNLSSKYEPISLQLSAQALMRVIRYLARNAAKAMNYRGIITICTGYLDSDTVQICFSDSGPGIRNDNPIRNRMFREPLAEGKRGGLGLLFARLHVEKLNGHIYLADYEEGKGATFCIRLPVKQSEEVGGGHE